MTHSRRRRSSAALAAAAAEDAPQPRAQTLGAALPPRGDGGGASVRVGIAEHPHGIVDGRWDLDREMRCCMQLNVRSCSFTD